MDSNPTICEEKFTTNNPNRKWGFIEKHTHIYIILVLSETKSKLDKIMFRTLLEINILDFLDYQNILKKRENLSI